MIITPHMHRIQQAALLHRAGGAASLVITAKTDNPGTSNDDQFTIQLFPGEAYDFIASYDGQVTVHNTDSDLVLTFPSGAGTYDISITGTLPRLHYFDTDDDRKLIDIKAWGDIAWSSMDGAFRGCGMTAVTATDAPDLSNVISLDQMFMNGLLTSIDVSSWDVGSIKTMTNMFRGNTSLAALDVSSWDTNSLTDAGIMFYQCDLLDVDVSAWDITALINAGSMMNLSAFSDANYDLLLVAWEGQTEPADVTFHAGGAKYSAGAPATARAALVSNGWNITDGGPA